jgi:hypothetical protein
VRAAAVCITGSILRVVVSVYVHHALGCRLRAWTRSCTHRFYALVNQYVCIEHAPCARLSTPCVDAPVCPQASTRSYRHERVDTVDTLVYKRIRAVSRQAAAAARESRNAAPWHRAVLTPHASESCTHALVHPEPARATGADSLCSARRACVGRPSARACGRAPDAATRPRERTESRSAERGAYAPRSPRRTQWRGLAGSHTPSFNKLP